MSRRQIKLGGDRDPLSLIEVLQALGDPIRLEIVRQLHETSDKACGTFGIDKPKSTMSHHFNVLRKSGVLGFEKRGSTLVNYIERERLNTRFPGLLESVLKGVETPKAPVPAPYRKTSNENSLSLQAADLRAGK